MLYQFIPVLHEGDVERLPQPLDFGLIGPNHRVQYLAEKPEKGFVITLEEVKPLVTIDPVIRPVVIVHAVLPYIACRVVKPVIVGG